MLNLIDWAAKFFLFYFGNKATIPSSGAGQEFLRSHFQKAQQKKASNCKITIFQMSSELPNRFFWHLGSLDFGGGGGDGGGAWSGGGGGGGGSG